MTGIGDLAGVLVVIPCLNEERHLPGLLDQLVADSRGALIVGVDGGSLDRSRDIVEAMAARHDNIRLLDNPARIQSAGVNLAARRFGAGRSWMVRVDAHCRYPREYVAQLLDSALAHDATSVVVPMVTEGHECFERATAAAQNSALGTGGSPHRHLGEGCWVDHGHHALFRLDLFFAAGGYDENFSHNEDAELDQRLLREGGRLWLEPGCALTYFPRRTPGALARQYANYGAGRRRTALRHAQPLKPRQLLPLAIAPVVFVALVGVILMAVTPFAALLILPAAVWALACLAFGALLAFRARSACVLLSGVAAMTMHAAWSAGFLREALTGRRLGPPPGRLTAE